MTQRSTHSLGEPSRCDPRQHGMRSYLRRLRCQMAHLRDCRTTGDRRELGRQVLSELAHARRFGFGLEDLLIVVDEEVGVSCDDMLAVICRLLASGGVPGRRVSETCLADV